MCTDLCTLQTLPVLHCLDVHDVVMHWERTLASCTSLTYLRLLHCFCHIGTRLSSSHACRPAVERLDIRCPGIIITCPINLLPPKTYDIPVRGLALNRVPTLLSGVGHQHHPHCVRRCHLHMHHVVSDHRQSYRMTASMQFMHCL